MVECGATNQVEHQIDVFRAFPEGGHSIVVGAPRFERRTAASFMTKLKVPRLHAEKVLNHSTGDIAEVYGNALVYRLDDVQYTSDPYHAFIAEPGAILGNQMAAWLDRASPFDTVALRGSTRPVQYVLDATVAELYGDFRAGRRPAAVLTLQFALIDQAGARPKVVYESTIARRVDLPQASPDALVRGYGKALEEILSQLVPEISAKNVGP
jgi:hypothetical protein